MAQPTIDPTFYRTAAEAAAAPVEQLAYVVAFDRAAQKNDAMTVVDVNPASFNRLRAAPHPPVLEGPLPRRPPIDHFRLAEVRAREGDPRCGLGQPVGVRVAV